uniref:Uncharacterized protein n=1 Tax=Anguilla anguilla TaxID=7936 RepID=A0A0E9WJX5_ANGAN
MKTCVVRPSQWITLYIQGKKGKSNLTTYFSLYIIKKQCCCSMRPACSLTCCRIRKGRSTLSYDTEPCSYVPRYCNETSLVKCHTKN